MTTIIDEDEAREILAELGIIESLRGYKPFTVDIYI